jgi:hypothetical protein
MQNRALRVGPVALSTTLTVTVLNCSLSALAGPTGYTQTQPYVILTHIRIVNKSSSGAATVSLYIGASGADAAGTEFAFNAYSVAQNSYVDWYGRVRLESTDYLTGGASAATSLTFQAEGEIGLT